jgi:hypothetical protein
MIFTHLTEGRDGEIIVDDNEMEGSVKIYFKTVSQAYKLNVLLTVHRSISV